MKRILRPLICSGWILCLSVCVANSQHEFPFLVQNLNVIRNEGVLGSFFQKLDDLSEGKVRQVRIVHIGDSHVQADYWTGRLRYLFQERYGNAGRGFVFPYRLADSNEPRDLRSHSNISWDYRKSLFQNAGIPIGLAGMAIRTQQPNFLFEVALKGGYFPDDPRFDKVTLFFQQGSNYQDLSVGYFLPGVTPAPVITPVKPKKYHTVKSGDNLYDLSRRYGCSVKDLQRWNGMRGTMLKIGKKLVVSSSGYVSAPAMTSHPFAQISTISTHTPVTGPGHAVCYLDTLMQSVVLKGVARQEKANEACLFGLTLENSAQNGVLYHSIGVNGATFAHYNAADYFWQQLPVLKPDLIIVSLGTNESVGKPSDSLRIQEDIRIFMDKLNNSAPETPVLVTTNPDILKRKRYPNPYGAIIRRSLLREADSRYLATWDLYGLMGGLGSIKSWRKEGLTAGDFVHFSQSGYELQANLLFDALFSFEND